MLEFVPIAIRASGAVVLALAAMQLEASQPRVGFLVGGSAAYVYLMLVRNRLVVPSVLLAALFYTLFGIEDKGGRSLHPYAPFALLMIWLLLPGREVDEVSLMSLTRKPYEVEIRKMFWKHDPNKVHLVDQLLADNKGNERAFLRSLRREYGEPDDGNDEPVGKNAGVSTSKVREDIVRLVKQKDSKNLKHCDAVLERYAGRELELLATLCKDYKVPRETYHYLTLAPPAETLGQYKPWDSAADILLSEERLKAKEAVRRGVAQVSQRYI